MTRAAAIFALLVAMLAAGAVLAQSVTPVRAIRSQTVLQAEDLGAGRGERARAASPRSRRRSARRPRSRSTRAGRSSTASSAPRRWSSATRWSACHYASGPLRIVTEGRALDRAGAGEPVRVMNLASRQTVTGTVAADGSIEVGQ